MVASLVRNLVVGSLLLVCRSVVVDVVVFLCVVFVLVIRRILVLMEDRKDVV